MPDPIPTQTNAEGQKQPGSGTKTKWLVSNRADSRVALWELDDAHPGGQVYFAGPVPEEAALTAGVSQALREEQLREATEAEISKRKKQLGEGAAAPPKGPWD